MRSGRGIFDSSEIGFTANKGWSITPFAARRDTSGPREDMWDTNSSVVEGVSNFWEVRLVRLEYLRALTLSSQIPEHWRRLPPRNYFNSWWITDTWAQERLKNYLWLGNPRPMIPAALLDTAVLSVSFASAKGWLWRVSPANVTVSSPTGPEAKVPVVESPYCRRTSAPVSWKVEDWV